MIVLDTNIVSELMHMESNSAVVSWLDAQQSPAHYSTAVTAAEMFFDVERMPSGKRPCQGDGTFKDIAPALWQHLKPMLTSLHPARPAVYR